ncbi:hypothetical protein [Thiothrix fructosivorans]|jgi:hypothetical protein|nr:hypothetical protein [Thiothrix fructosivorans]
MPSHNKNKQLHALKCSVLRCTQALCATLFFMGTMPSMADIPLSLSHNLDLSAELPEVLHVKASDIAWQIRTQDGTQVAPPLVGASPQVTLPNGTYEVQLSVGGYTEHKTVQVNAGQVTTLPFSPKVGRLRVRSLTTADWQVTAVAVGASARAYPHSTQLDTLVAAGDYEVEAKRPFGISYKQRLSVTAGMLTAASIQIPTGKVSLIATLGDAPALRPMTWTVYRLDGAKQLVAAPRRHSATLEVSPGHYEAVANLNGLERRRSFTVLTDTRNQIVIAMD